MKLLVFFYINSPLYKNLMSFKMENFIFIKQLHKIEYFGNLLFFLT